MRTLHVLILMLSGLGASGCAFGPNAIERSHGRYNAALQQVEEEQFLKNIVRLRYSETPRNLDVAAIATQFELSAHVEARPFFSTETSGNVFRSFKTLLPFAALSSTTRPTISYDPHDDATTVRQFLTPISDDVIVFLAQSGWPVSSLLRIWANSLNGVPNWTPTVSTLRNRPADFKRFLRAVELLQIAQDHEWVSVVAEVVPTEYSDPLPKDAVNGLSVTDAAKHGYEYRHKGDGWTLVKRLPQLFFQINAIGKDQPEMQELKSLINLSPTQNRYRLTVTHSALDPVKHSSEPEINLTISPRSTAQAMMFLSRGVMVPPKHAAANLVQQSTDCTDENPVTANMFTIRSCAGSPRKPPACAYVACWYRDHWFYIDDCDHESKATLLLMLQLRRLDFRHHQTNTSPLLTLPVGR